MAANVPRICHFPSKCLSRSLLVPPACDSAHSAKHHKTRHQLIADTRACCYSPVNCHGDLNAQEQVSSSGQPTPGSLPPPPGQTDALCALGLSAQPYLLPTHPCSSALLSGEQELLKKHSCPCPPPPHPQAQGTVTPRKQSWLQALGCRLSVRGKPGQEVGGRDAEGVEHHPAECVLEICPPPLQPHNPKSKFRSQPGPLQGSLGVVRSVAHSEFSSSPS